MERAKDLYDRILIEKENAIDSLILSRKSEELFLDFKRSADDGANKTLHDNDRKNLSKAISGFGNSEGGVIIWGVDCSKDDNGADVAKSKKLIKDVHRFTSLLNSIISGVTIPPHNGVLNKPIPVNKDNEGYVLTYIPKSNHAPHQSTTNKQYYMRAGSNFEPVTHSILAGMFGRRPQPNVFGPFICTPAHINEDVISFSLSFCISNDGPGIASDIFFSLLLHNTGKQKWELSTIDSRYWTIIRTIDQKIIAVSNPDIRLPPLGDLIPFSILFKIKPPFTEPIELEGMIGSASSIPYKFFLESSPQKMNEAYEQLMNMQKDGTINDGAKDNFASNFFERK